RPARHHAAGAGGGVPAVCACRAARAGGRLPSAARRRLRLRARSRAGGDLPRSPAGGRVAMNSWRMDLTVLTDLSASMFAVCFMILLVFLGLAQQRDAEPAPDLGAIDAGRALRIVRQ